MRSNPRCNDPSTRSRRRFIQVGGLCGLASLFGQGSIGGRDSLRSAEQARSTSKKQAILVWLDGGPTHLELWDPKPDAAEEVRGPFGTTTTSVPGVRIGEFLPRVGKQFDDWLAIRSVTSPLGEHNFGTHYMMSGYKPTPVLEYPSIGGWVASQTKQGELPSHIAVPRFRVGGSTFSGQGFLDSRSAPFSVGGDPARPDFSVDDLAIHSHLPESRLMRRQAFLRDLEAMGDQSQDPNMQQAFKLLLSSESQAAFDLTLESDETRRRYGPKTVGQSCLLARRLIETGVPFVTVTDPGWDTHDDAIVRLRDGYAGSRNPIGKIPSLDLALSALVDDLRDRGLLETTLVMVMGEFGRTPKLNTNGGRDHWPRCFSVAMAGGGTTGGQIIGSSDRHGESPRDNAVTPADLAHSTLRLMGIDPSSNVQTPDGRPIALNRDGKWIEALSTEA